MSMNYSLLNNMSSIHTFRVVVAQLIFHHFTNWHCEKYVHIFHTKKVTYWRNKLLCLSWYLYNRISFFFFFLIRRVHQEVHMVAFWLCQPSMGGKCKSLVGLIFQIHCLDEPYHWFDIPYQAACHLVFMLPKYFPSCTPQWRTFRNYVKRCFLCFTLV